MLGAPLIWDQVVQVGEPCEKRLLAPLWVVKPLHGEGLPLDGVVGLIQQGAGHRHLLKANGQDEGQHAFEKRFPIAQELKVGGFVLKIDGDGPVYAWLFGCVMHVPPRLSGLCYA
jgi:hypothetical protein